MNPRIETPAAPGGISRAASAGPDAFALASARLNAQRPVRDARLKQILTVVQSNLFRLAQTQLADYLARHPNDADAINLRARVAARLEQRGEAVALLARCLDIAPGFAAARYHLAYLLCQQNEFEAALKQVDTLLAQDGRNPLFRQMKADILEHLGDSEQVLAICEQLASENPGRAESWIRLGHALRGLGLQDRSVAAYRQAIECRPSNGQAYWSLANMKTVRFDDADVDAMQAQLERRDIGADDRITLQFSLGKAHEDAGRYEQAFMQYDQANAAMRKRISYDAATLTDGVAANKALFTPAFVQARRGWGCPAPDPIFILGRPRSGSTLVEQILASHSAIEATAELPYVTALAARLNGLLPGRPAYGSDYLKPLASMDAAALAELGEEVLRRARLHRRLDRPFFIDKKPANFAHVGLIHLMLPNAKIIDVRRHPAGCCWSMFRTYSSKGRLRLDELGRFYRDYVALMAHFDSVLPGRVHRVIYEDLVRDPEAETRKLLDYLGLPFEPACLRFHETGRAILTPSSEQVRQPINSRAVEHWKHFEPWLGPLVDSLGSVMATYPAVPDDLR
ncbi:tetratricopeptide repeat-containing sulfotransferase family protein [Ideonella sp.]|uniref:tetratricopeptide repeat-containing sulfotransferase family protein n=1 Tax=Ideonella sp. TaxID=1929293 RepID=UPI002B4635D2|nr:sulfotransferase [Ideonella sp.]HJV69471.1 sulfotransferase [Ideonella sp.]